MRTTKEIRREMTAIKSEMKAKGIRRVSCFNGGLHGEVYSLNAKLFSLSTELETATQANLPKPESATAVEGAGIESLMGERVLLMCANYFYTGKLVGVNETCVELEDPAIVYETGQWTAKTYADEQKLHAKTFYVSLAAIEAFGVSK